MAASTGKKGSKIDFSKSIKETIAASSFPKHSADTSENVSAVGNVEDTYSDIKNEFEEKNSDIYKNNVNNVNNINNVVNENNINNKNDADGYLQINHPDKKKIDIDELKKEAGQRKREKGIKHTTFSVSYKIGGEFEKLMLVASEKHGYNRSVYMRQLMLDDYIKHKEEYDQILQHL